MCIDHVCVFCEREIFDAAAGPDFFDAAAVD
jgi:hypothetical protein